DGDEVDAGAEHRLLRPARARAQDEADDGESGRAHGDYGPTLTPVAGPWFQGFRPNSIPVPSLNLRLAVQPMVGQFNIMDQASPAIWISGPSKWLSNSKLL